MASNEETRIKLRNQNCIEFMEWGCRLFPTDLPLAVNTSWALRRLCRYNLANSEAVLASGVLKHIIECLEQHY